MNSSRLSAAPPAPRLLGLFATLLLGAPSAFAQATYSLSTTTYPNVWNYNTSNWVNAAGDTQGWPGGYNGRPNATISGPARAVDVTGTQFCTLLKLSNGVTLGSSQGNELYAGAINGSGTVVLNNRIIGESSLAVASNGAMTFRETNTTPILTLNGSVKLDGALARFNAGSISMGTLDPGNGIANTNLFTSTAGSEINCGGALSLGVMRVGQSYATITDTVVTTGGDFVIGQNAHSVSLNLSGGALNLGGNLTIAPTPDGSSLGAEQISLANTTITLADTGSQPGINGTYFAVGHQGSFVGFPGSTIRVRTGGFLTFGLDRFVVSNTTVDTTGGNALMNGRFSYGTGKLIKTGPGILKIVAANEYGVDTSGFDIRGGYIEFSGRHNFGPADAPEANIGAPTKNIILNGGGLRWATGTKTDISLRLQTLAAPSFDTNGSA